MDTYRGILISAGSRAGIWIVYGTTERILDVCGTARGLLHKPHCLCGYTKQNHYELIVRVCINIEL